MPLLQTKRAHYRTYFRLSGAPDAPDTAGHVAEPKESSGAPTHLALLRLKTSSGEATTRASPPQLDERGGYEEEEGARLQELSHAKVMWMDRVKWRDIMNDTNDSVNE